MIGDIEIKYQMIDADNKLKKKYAKEVGYGYNFENILADCIIDLNKRLEKLENGNHENIKR